MGASGPGATGELNELRSILIVDDDRDIRDAMEELLVDRGFSVFAASNGAEALKLLRTLPAPPSIILLDVMMPVMDGYGFLEEQRKDASLSQIPVAIITAGQGVDLGRLGGTMPVLYKPISVPELMIALRSVRQSTSER
jgi:two-component system chemotaxis response regulator CheY